MIRLTMSEDLKEYYNDIDTATLPEAELLKTTNFFLFRLSLYRMPDMYKINGKDEPVYIYSFSTGKKRPTVNCTDILGGTMKWDEVKKKSKVSYPIAFINAIVCVLFKRWNAFTVCTNNKGMFDESDTPENFALALKNVAYNNIQAVRFIKTLATTDVDNIYAIGVSLGALTIEGAYAIEDSYKKAVVIIGGYSLTDIIASSEESMVEEFFSSMMNLGSYQTVTKTKKLISDAIAPIENVITSAPGEGILQIVMSNKDKSVPSEFQKKYTEAVKPKEVINLAYIPMFAFGELKNGHYQTLLYYPYLIYRSLKFLSKKENKEIKPVTEKLSVFFEWTKLIQRVIMVILTVGLLLVMRTASYEIRDMKNELAEFNKKIDRIQAQADKYYIEITKGIRIRLW